MTPRRILIIALCFTMAGLSVFTRGLKPCCCVSKAMSQSQAESPSCCKAAAQPKSCCSQKEASGSCPIGAIGPIQSCKCVDQSHTLALSTVQVSPNLVRTALTFDRPTALEFTAPLQLAGENVLLPTDNRPEPIILKTCVLII